MEDIEVYYKNHGKKVYYYLLSIVHDDNLAEELTQETFYQAMKTINKYRGDYGSKELTQHIWQIIGMAKACEDINELKQMASEKFSKDINF